MIDFTKPLEACCGDTVCRATLIGSEHGHRVVLVDALLLLVDGEGRSRQLLMYGTKDSSWKIRNKEDGGVE